jgi:hypothetical protein
VLFFDTDAELRERAPSRLAIAAADRAVLMLSADWRAYIRLKARTPMHPVWNPKRPEIY